MTIQEILEAHDYTIVEERFESHGKIQTIVCGCGDRYGFFVTHQKHVAELIDQRMREREAEAWDECAKTFPEYDPLYDINPYK